MSKVRANNFTNKAGTGAPTFPHGAVVTGVATATTFSGNITGNVTGNINATGVSTLGNTVVGGATTQLVVTGDARVTGILTIGTSSVTLDGTNNQVNVGSGVTIHHTNGVQVGSNTLHSTGLTLGSGEVNLKGAVENVSAATTYNSSTGSLVLELDVRNSTTYRYSMPTGANIGIVSFKNMPANTENGSTVTVLFTQPSSITAGTGNTTVTTGIGTNCTVIPYVSGSPIAGISTRALVGSATTVTLSTTGNDVDFVSFFIHYTGGTNTSASSYKVYVTKNGGFRQGIIGV